MLDPLIWIRTIHFAASLMLAGVAYFRFFTAGPPLAALGGKDARRLGWEWRSIAWISLATLLGSGALWLLLVASRIGGAPIVETLSDGTVWRVATGTVFGQVWILRLTCTIIVAVLLWAQPPARSFWQLALPIVTTVLLAALAWPSHSGATPGGAGNFFLAADALHLVAAGGWLGGLLPLALLLSRAGRGKGWIRFATAVTRRFSAMGIACVAALLVTGTVNTWNLVGSLTALTDTRYGQLVLVKIGLFAAMVGLAAINRFRLTPRLGEQRAIRALARNAGIETALGLTVVAVVGVLGTLPPALHEGHTSHWSSEPGKDAAFVHIHTPEAMAEVTISPGRAGPVSIAIRILREDVTPLPAQRVTLTLSGPEKGAAPVRRDAVKQSEGLWSVEGVTVPLAGVWNLGVRITLNDRKMLSLPGPIVIEPGAAQ